MMGVSKATLYDPPRLPNDNEEREAVDGFVSAKGLCNKLHEIVLGKYYCHRKKEHQGDHVMITLWKSPAPSVYLRWPQIESHGLSKGRHTTAKKCECGAASIGSPMHSSWCPLA